MTTEHRKFDECAFGWGWPDGMLYARVRSVQAEARKFLTDEQTALVEGLSPVARHFSQIWNASCPSQEGDLPSGYLPTLGLCLASF